MIKAELEKSAQSFRLSISGHAGYAPRGEDIVCAVVSALVQGLSGYVRRLEREGLAGRHTGVQIGPGEAEICLCPEKQAAERSAGAFALAEEILSLLGKHFPENIQFTVKRRNTNDN